MKRSLASPVLTRAHIPPVRPDLCDVTSVFNPGAVRVEGRELLLLRVQTRGRETVLMPAERTPERRFEVWHHVVQIQGLDQLGLTIHHVYDPRLTLLEGVVYAIVALDLDDGCRLALARTHDFKDYTLVSADTEGDRRNGVLFPERVGGRYLRLERPNLVTPPGGATSGDEILLAESEDLVTWNVVGPVMAGRPHYWDELIGSGPPPVKTHAGWLHVYHGVALHLGTGIYQAGAVLLDLQDPSRVLARTRQNLLEPRREYELVGQVPNVVFPTGLVVEEVDGQGFALPHSRVRIYYGAADTVVGLAVSTVTELLDRCHE